MGPGPFSLTINAAVGSTLDLSDRIRQEDLGLWAMGWWLPDVISVKSWWLLVEVDFPQLSHIWGGALTGGQWEQSCCYRAMWNWWSFKRCPNHVAEIVFWDVLGSEHAALQFPKIIVPKRFESWLEMTTVTVVSGCFGFLGTPFVCGNLPNH